MGGHDAGSLRGLLGEGRLHVSLHVSSSPRAARLRGEIDISFSVYLFMYFSVGDLFWLCFPESEPLIVARNPAAR